MTQELITAAVDIANWNTKRETEKAIFVDVNINLGNNSLGLMTVPYSVAIPKSLIEKEELSYRKDMYIAHLPLWWLQKKAAEIRDEILHSPQTRNTLIEAGYQLEYYETIAKAGVKFWN